MIVVATKIDLVEPSEREAAYERIAAPARDDRGRRAALRGLGRDGRACRRAETRVPRRARGVAAAQLDAPVYLPIDRGLYVDRTRHHRDRNVDARQHRDRRALVLEPGGKPAHVRSIGVFESTRQRVEAGSRVALNLPGIDRRELARGQAIVGPEFSAGQNFAVRFTPLRDAHCRSCAGGLRCEPTSDLPRSSARSCAREPPDGAGGAAKLRLREPVVAFPGAALRGAASVTDDAAWRRFRGRYRSGAPAATLIRRSGVLAVLTARPRAVELGEIAFAANLREASALRGAERSSSEETSSRF